jgi:hypothetical protein
MKAEEGYIKYMWKGFLAMNPMERPRRSALKISAGALYNAVKAVF